MKRLELKVQGMTCNHCVNTVRRALMSLEGVSDVKVSLETGSVEVFLEGEVPLQKLINAVEEWGYKVVNT
jgi:copper ion binding protein